MKDDSQQTSISGVLLVQLLKISIVKFLDVHRVDFSRTHA